MSRYRPRVADGPRDHKIEFSVSSGELDRLRRWGGALGKSDTAFIWLCVESVCAQMEAAALAEISPVDCHIRTA